MAYTPYYSGGWQSGEQGGTPITPAALNHIDQGIAGITPASIEAVIGNGTVTVKRIPNTGSRAVTITCTNSEQMFLVIGAVANTTNNRVAVLVKSNSTDTVYETTVVGSAYHPTVSDNVISLVDKRTYEQFIIMSNYAFTYTG